MKSNLVTRRDALKLIGMTAAAAATAKILRPLELSARAGADARPPGVILLIFDTLSARNMSLYGYPRATTPNIEAFARNATVYHRNYAAANFTHPSTASLFTGVHPWSHRSFDSYAALLEPHKTENIFRQLGAQYKTIAYTHNSYAADLLRQLRQDIDELKRVEDLMLFDADGLANSFENDASLGFYAAKKWRDDPQSHSLFLNPLFRVATTLAQTQTNAQYRRQYPLGLGDNAEGALFKLEDAIDWIAQTVNAQTEPFFGYFHLLPPHETYRPRADFLNLFAGDGFKPPRKPEHFFSDPIAYPELVAFRQRYDEYIAFTDAEFGRLVKLLEDSGALERSYLFLTSDHGQLLERGVHGHATPLVYEPVIHVPLVVRAPGQKQRVDVHAPTSLIDLLPTLLSLSGLPRAERLEGRVLPQLGGEADSGRMLFSAYARENAKMKPLTHVTFSALQYPYKLIVYKGYAGFEDTTELYDLENDPEELNDIAAQKSSVVAALKDELERNQKQAEARALGI